jgi:hypothetical protein
LSDECRASVADGPWGCAVGVSAMVAMANFWDNLVVVVRTRVGSKALA